MNRRIAITGMGVTTALGCSVDTFWSNLLSGMSGIGPITLFDTSAFPSRIAGEVSDWDNLAGDFFTTLDRKRLDRCTQMALYASQQAVDGSGLEVESLGDRLGVSFGTGVGGVDDTSRHCLVHDQRGPRKVSPYIIAKIIPNAPAGNIAIRFNARGPATAITAACATGASSIAEGMTMIRQGRVDAAICGGTEAAVSPVTLAGFSQMKALSSRNDSPQQASRPFDKARDGFVMAEGAAALLLEDMETAEKRGAKILAELLGFGASCDAHHIAAPSPDSEGVLSAMRWCLRDANLDLSEISYVNAHATGTTLGDICELRGLETIFAERASDLLVSSTKGQLGHLLGAAGAVESVIAVKTIQTGMAPACTNCDDPEQTSVRLILDEPCKFDCNVVLSTSFGFGGHNMCLAFR